MSGLVLASASPRRRELMKLTGFRFTSTVADIDETVLPEETPEDHVTRLSVKKAETAAAQHTDAIVIGCDTVVVLDGEILGKPGSRDDASLMLARLAGNTHTVYTGFALVDTADGRTFSAYESTDVTMRPIPGDIIQAYLDTGESMDKAGAYGIQGYGAALVTRIEGCYFTVMGLPVARLVASLVEFTGGAYGYFGASQGL